MNSHYKNTVVLRGKQGGLCEFCSWELANLVLKMWYDRKALAKKASHAGSRMRTSLLLRDDPLHSFRQKISRHPPSLVTASAQALSGLPDAGATMSLCQGQDLPRCVWCAPSFCWGIIKRGNGVGRTEWKSRRRGGLDRANGCSCQLCRVVDMLFVFLSLRFCVELFPHQDLVLKFVVNLHSVLVIKKKTFRLIKNNS